MTGTYHAVLGTDKQNKLAIQLGFPQHSLIMAREWITKDLMIIATADYLKCDVALTIDEKTFMPLCKEIDYFGCLCKKEKFDANDTYIFAYNH